MKRDWKSWLLAALAALLVAQVLLPADTVTPAQGAALPHVMLWLLLLLVYLVTTLFATAGPLRLGITDLAFFGLILWHTVAGLVALRTGAPRPAWNVLWTWVGLGGGFFLVRQLAGSSQACRALTAVMIGLSAGLAGLGGYQVAKDFPEMRRKYEQDPEAELRQAFGLGPTAHVDRLAKKQFEDRLYSPQPYATFSLANSLAGYLTTWLVVALGVLGAARRDKTLSSAAWYAVVLLISGVGVTLILTHSRTGYLAAIAGVLLLAATRCGQPPNTARAARIAGFLFLLLIATAVALLQWDHASASAARKSLAYRWQYWQASLALIKDHPGLGGGPGNFGDLYTAYKLPAAYEEVGDPHNFLLEVWATAGTPAMLALLLTLACFLVRVLRQAGSKHEPTAAATDARTIAVGGLAGFALVAVLATAYGPVIESAITWGVLGRILLPAAACFALLWRWITIGTFPALLPLIGFAVLCLHLSASGGIGNPGLAGSLWLLMALGLNLTERPGHTLQVSRSLALAATATVLVAILACQWTAYSPVVQSQSALSAADRFASQADPPLTTQKLQDAANLDPLATQPRRRLVFDLAQNWLVRREIGTDQPHSTLRAQLDRQVKAWLENAPHSSQIRRELGHLYLRFYRTSGEQPDLREAIRYYQAAVERYPHSSLLHAHLAWAHHLAGNRDPARLAATRALNLDQQNPHPDQRLDNPLLKIADPQPDVWQTSPAELMTRVLAN
ncbi:MAG: hypothetical protein GTO53_05455 [Planctomycetales bacterium]|nr:hypothetical protein [Planctomycetales bacterium]NIM08594.1 hypothetical protein [Planctomycetales bacterium]NIN08062.1 hypothetical protein [Planctomycetales bacterium]NIN77196.1 hypothetical protein [Planctomycetales bacterium]NIO34378.1 hypothetical protein [Planctomycetales bacterium]